MADFFEGEIQATGELSTTGADATRRLSNILGEFSQLAGKERAKVVQRKSLAAGREAGAKGLLPTESEFNLANQAFNIGLRNSYLAEVDGDIRQSIGRMADENPLNPEAFENAVFALEEGLLKGIDDEEIRAGITQNIRQRGEAAFLNISNAKRSHDRAVSWDRTNTEINELNIEAQENMAAGDVIQSGIAIVKAFNFLDEAVKAGQIDLETATKRKRKIERDATIESIRFEVERDFQSLDSYGKALQRLEDRNKPDSFTEQEWIDTKDQIEADLKNSIDRRQLDEANQVKILDGEQKANFDRSYVQMVSGNITGIQIKRMAEDGEITGIQMNKLLDRLSSKGRGFDDPLIVNEVSQLIAANQISAANKLIQDNWGTNLTDSTSIDLFSRVETEGDPESILGSPEAKRWRRSLQIFLGQEGLLTKFDFGVSSRIERATIEYNDLVANGGDPRSSMNSILQKNQTPDKAFEGLRNVRFSDQKDDSKAIVKSLTKARDAGHITEAEYQSELDYLFEVIEPARNIKNDYNKFLQDNSKQVKAAE